jgi:hypothetical protein
LIPPERAKVVNTPPTWFLTDPQRLSDHDLATKFLRVALNISVFPNEQSVRYVEHIINTQLQSLSPQFVYDNCIEKEELLLIAETFGFSFLRTSFPLSEASTVYSVYFSHPHLQPMWMSNNIHNEVSFVGHGYTENYAIARTLALALTVGTLTNYNFAT